MEKTLVDFSKEEIDLGDKAYIETMSHIKKTVSEYLDKEEIKYEMWSAVREGMKMFCEEYYSDIIKVISKEVAEQIKQDLNINFDVVVKHKK